MVNTAQEDLHIYLQATPFIDSDSPVVIDFAQIATGNADTDIKKAVKLYYAVRDGIHYSPYAISFDPEKYKAGWVLQNKAGFCVQKAILLAALGRAMNIPSRLGFADVRNHLTTKRLRDLMKTDEFVFHGFTELFLDGKWVKATPAFNLALCERFGVKPLEFDGITDSVFHPFDQNGGKHMEYIRDHGVFADFPLEKMILALKAGYPHLFKKGGKGWPASGNFEKEAATH